MSSLPSHLQDCPPVAEQALPRRVFRLLGNNTLEDSDFLSFAEMGRLPEPSQPVKACRWHGLSVFSNMEDAQQVIELYGDKPFIAFADLLPEHGVAVETPGKYPSHMTWWPIEGLDRKSRFTCV